ncbi:hypothetical protein PoB_006547200 [Plakobranchus ocellatus]|uniref:Uncharacterized protein n=1 Tax=Plakobranchus ocellatus TaxID=259542 RepID=A0AAV4D4B3_9GAST|nr:hypothetical protein PoB_006547200 [Plakobranchus ocellatus]
MKRKERQSGTYYDDKGSMANSSTYLGDIGDESQLSKSYSPRYMMRANTRSYPGGMNGGFPGGGGLKALDYSYDNSSSNFDPAFYSPKSKGQADFQQSYYFYDNTRIV